MRAARLHLGESRLRIEDVPAPGATGDQVVVRVVGAGVCHSDLHLLDGMFAEMMRLPVTMGHEIAGRVEAVGPNVRDLEPGADAVIDFVGTDDTLALASRVVGNRGQVALLGLAGGRSRSASRASLPRPR